MCSRNDPDFDILKDKDKEMEQEEKKMQGDINSTLASNICIKCKMQSFTVNTRHATYCNECFLNQCYRKYRCAIAKANFTKSEKILIHLSGGSIDAIMSSLVLFHLIQLAIKQQGGRNNLNEFYFIYFDNDLDGTLIDYLLNRCKGIQIERIDTFDHVNRLSFYKEMENEEERNVTISESHESLVSIYRKVILLHKGKSLNCSKIYTSETNTALAGVIIDHICCGNGVVVAWSIEHCQSYCIPNTNDMPSIVRPLREFTDLEVSQYFKIIFEENPMENKNNGIEVENYHLDSSVINNVRESSSVHDTRKIVKEFLDELDMEYSSTVHAVTNTASKLKRLGNSFHPCILCLVPLPDDIIKGELCNSCKNIIEELPEKFNAPPYMIEQLSRQKGMDG